MQLRAPVVKQGTLPNAKLHRSTRARGVLLIVRLLQCLEVMRAKQGVGIAGRNRIGGLLISGIHRDMLLDSVQGKVLVGASSWDLRGPLNRVHGEQQLAEAPLEGCPHRLDLLLQLGGLLLKSHDDDQALWVPLREERTEAVEKYIDGVKVTRHDDNVPKPAATLFL